MVCDLQVNFQRRRVEQASARLTLASVLVVFFGGAIGTLVRAALVFDASESKQLWLIGLINVLGAGGFGLLLEAISAPEASSTGRRRMRLCIGTGFFGGFTTYSSLSLLIASLALDEQFFVAVAYALGTIILGALATALGLLLGILLRLRGSREREPQAGGR